MYWDMRDGYFTHLRSTNALIHGGNQLTLRYHVIQIQNMYILGSSLRNVCLTLVKYILAKLLSNAKVNFDHYSHSFKLQESVAL